MNYITVSDYSARARLQSRNDSLSIWSNSSGVVEESQAGLHINIHKQHHQNYSREDFTCLMQPLYCTHHKSM